MAGGITDENVFLDVFSTGWFRAVTECRLLAVFSGQGADAVGDVHQHIGSVYREATLARTGDVLFRHNRGKGTFLCFLPLIPVRGTNDRLLGVDHNGLKVFTSTNTTGAPASTGTVVLVDPVGEAGEFFPCLADGNHREFFLTILVLEEFDRLMHPLAPEFRGIQ